MLGYFIFRGYSLNRVETTEPQSNPQIETSDVQKAIAVLPFDNYSASREDNQYLCDGFMEEIINHMSEIKSLAVRSRSSVEQYRSDRPSSVDIGAQLAVSHLIEGIADAYMTRGLYYDMIGNADQAFSDMQKAYELDPNNYLTTWNLGKTHFRMKNPIEGLRLVDKALKQCQGDPYMFWIYHSLGLMYMELYDKQESLHQWNMMSDLEPNHLVILWSEAYIETPEVAQELLQKLLSLYPNEASIYRLLGRFSTNLKDYKKAIEYYNDSPEHTGYESDEFIIDANAHRGLAQWLAGDQQKGQQIIGQALADYQQMGNEQKYFCDREVRIAAIHAFLGNKQQAYEWLLKSNWTNAALYDVQQDVWFSNINQEQEFQDIVAAAMEEKRKVREEIARLKAAGEWEL